MTKRNEPCPCGSGRKYKYCCLNFPTKPDEPTPPGMQLQRSAYGDLGMDPSDFENILMPFFDHPGIIRLPDSKLETNPRCALTVVLETVHETQPECKPNPDRLPDAVFETAKKRVLALPEFKHLAGYPQTGPAMVERIVDLALDTLLEGRIVVRRSGRLVTTAAYQPDVEARNYRRLYLQMFRVLSNDVLWAMPIDVALFEDFFGFTLLQLARSGGEPTLISQFTREFYTALPMLYSLASAGYENPSGDEAATCYAIGVLYCFWGLLGLVDIEPSDDAHRNRLDHIVTARPLLGELVTFPREWVHPVVNPSAPDFDGLSPDAMHALIYEPFKSPNIISYAGSADDTSAPILVVLEEVIRAGETGGLKATGTGAFPRAFVQDIGPRVRSAYELYWAEFEKSIQKEADVVTLEAARMVLELSGVLRKYKGKFIIGRDFRAAIKKHGVGGVYPVLFETAARKFNWGFADGLPNLPRIQLFAGFTLRLLTRYGDTPRPDTFYADAFIRAFPAMLNEVREGAGRAWETSHGTLSSAFNARVFPVFGHLMGIARLERAPGAHYDAPFMITATRLLRAFVRIHV